MITAKTKAMASFDDFENENLCSSTDAAATAAIAELKIVLRSRFQHDGFDA